MKKIRCWQYYLLLLLGILLWGTGCEDDPDTENVQDHFEGQTLVADTSTPTGNPERPNTATPALAILPADEIKLETNGDIIELTLSGAVEPVVWSVRYPSRGRIPTSSSTAATYQRDTAGDNVVIVSDAAGRTEFKVIKQPAP